MTKKTKSDFIISYIIIKTKGKPKCKGFTCYYAPDDTYLYDDEGNNAWKTREQAKKISDEFIF